MRNKLSLWWQVAPAARSVAFSAPVLLLLQKCESVAIEGDQALAPHLAKLGGKRAAIDAQVVGQLTGALIGLARATEGNAYLVGEVTDKLVEKALFATLTNVNFSEESILALIDEVAAEKSRLVSQCDACASACGRNDDYDMAALWGAQEDVRSLKSLLLFGIRGIFSLDAERPAAHDVASVIERLNCGDGARPIQQPILSVGQLLELCRAHGLAARISKRPRRLLEALARKRAATACHLAPVGVQAPSRRVLPVIVLAVHVQLQNVRRSFDDQVLFERLDAVAHLIRQVSPGHARREAGRLAQVMEFGSLLGEVVWGRAARSRTDARVKLSALVWIGGNGRRETIAHVGLLSSMLALPPCLLAGWCRGLRANSLSRLWIKVAASPRRASYHNA